MNAPFKADGGLMTSKGQILIPKAVRDAAGLAPGKPFKVWLNDDGQVSIAPLGFGPEDAELRVQQMRKGLQKWLGKYRTGKGTDAIMRELRGDWEP